jgi:hypothetical protein
MASELRNGRMTFLRTSVVLLLVLIVLAMLRSGLAYFWLSPVASNPSVYGNAGLRDCLLALLLFVVAAITWHKGVARNAR